MMEVLLGGEVDLYLVLLALAAGLAMLLRGISWPSGPAKAPEAAPAAAPPRASAALPGLPPCPAQPVLYGLYRGLLRLHAELAQAVAQSGASGLDERLDALAVVRMGIRYMLSSPSLHGVAKEASNYEGWVAAGQEALACRETLRALGRGQPGSGLSEFIADERWQRGLAELIARYLDELGRVRGQLDDASRQFATATASFEAEREKIKALEREVESLKEVNCQLDRERTDALERAAALHGCREREVELGLLFTAGDSVEQGLRAVNAEAGSGVVPVAALASYCLLSAARAIVRQEAASRQVMLDNLFALSRALSRWQGFEGVPAKLEGLRVPEAAELAAPADGWREGASWGVHKTLLDEARRLVPALPGYIYKAKDGVAYRVA